MVFDLANAVLIFVEDLHVAILLQTNESLGRRKERDLSRKTEVTILSQRRNKKGISASLIRKAFLPPIGWWSTTNLASPLLLLSQPPSHIAPQPFSRAIGQRIKLRLLNMSSILLRCFLFPLLLLTIQNNLWATYYFGMRLWNNFVLVQACLADCSISRIEKLNSCVRLN